MTDTGLPDASLAPVGGYKPAPKAKPPVAVAVAEKPVTRVVGYVRVSTQDQADSGLGLEAQRARILEAVAARGWEFAGFHEDAGVSAKYEATRPGLMAAIKQIESGDASVLVVAKLDRLAR